MECEAQEPTDRDIFERFFRMSLDLCCVASLGGRFRRVNPAFRLLGYSEQELLATPFLELVHPDDRDATRAELDKLALGVPTIRFENRYRCKDGSYRWLAWTTSPCSSGTLFAIARDVSETKRAYEAERALLLERLEQQKHQYQAIFDTLPQMIWLKAPDDRMIRVNAAAARSIGLTPADVEGRRSTELYPTHAGRYRRDDLEVISAGKPKLDIVEPYEVAPGDIRWVRTDKTPYRDADGKVVGVVVSATEVTGWKRSEEERARLYEQLKERDELKTRFFANVSHELRTPLTLIIGPVAKLLRAPALDAGVRRQLEVVLRNARTLHKRVNDLLDVARLDAGRVVLHYARVDVAELVKKAAAHFESVAVERRLSFSVDVKGPLFGQVDPEEITRVLDNVFANAFKFTPPDGSVRCTVRGESPSETRPRGRLTFEIADSGPGIDPAMRELIFERFQRAGGDVSHVGGTGLGLAIAKELVTLHGGRIFAGEAPEGGALFTIELPILAPPGSTVAEATDRGAVERDASPWADAVGPAEVSSPRLLEGAALAAQAEAGDRRALVLVVEDNNDMNRFLSDELSAEYRVAKAFDGQEGLEMARALKPSLVVTDIMMPRLDGLALLAALRADAELSAVPVILLTARADEDTLVVGMGSGADDYLTKPFSSRELWARVRAHIELAERRAEVTLRQHEAARLRMAVRARDEFLSVASHELRTPLSALQLNLQVLERLPRDPEGPRAERLAVALRACKNLGTLIDTLLDVGRASTGHLELHESELDLGGLLRELVRRFEAELAAAGCSVALRLEGPLVGCWDRLRLEQLFGNLLSNAIKFGAQRPIEITGTADDGTIRVSVRDHGVGIAAEDQTRIFQRFEQAAPIRRHAGLGLGLWIAREIVRRHKGTIGVESRLGEGATFTVTLPRTCGEPR